MAPYGMPSSGVSSAFALVWSLPNPTPSVHYLGGWELLAVTEDLSKYLGTLVPVNASV